MSQNSLGFRDYASLNRVEIVREGRIGKEFSIALGIQPKWHHRRCVVTGAIPEGPEIPTQLGASGLQQTARRQGDHNGLLILLPLEKRTELSSNDLNGRGQHDCRSN